MCDTHGAVASLRAINLRVMSPTTIHRIPPSFRLLKGGHKTDGTLAKRLWRRTSGSQAQHKKWKRVPRRGQNLPIRRGVPLSWQTGLVQRPFVQNVHSGTTLGGRGGTAVALPDKWSRRVGGLLTRFVTSAPSRKSLATFRKLAHPRSLPPSAPCSHLRSDPNTNALFARSTNFKQESKRSHTVCTRHCRWAVSRDAFRNSASGLSAPNRSDAQRRETLACASATRLAHEKTDPRHVVKRKSGRGKTTNGEEQKDGGHAARADFSHSLCAREGAHQEEGLDSMTCSFSHCSHLEDCSIQTCQEFSCSRMSESIAVNRM